MLEPVVVDDVLVGVRVKAAAAGCQLCCRYHFGIGVRSRRFATNLYGGAAGTCLSKQLEERGRGELEVGREEGCGLETVTGCKVWRGWGRWRRGREGHTARSTRHWGVGEASSASAGPQR